PLAVPSSPTTPAFLFFFYLFGYLGHLHSFPTRRSSDLLSMGGVSFPPPASGVFVCWAHAEGYAALFHPIKSRDPQLLRIPLGIRDRKSTRLNSSHVKISYAVFCLKKKIYASTPISL